jgi:hypothetical protein
MGLFRLLFYIFLFYAIYSLISFMIRVYRAKKHFENTYNGNPENIKKREGETSVTYIPDSENKAGPSSPASDDYIEYEELK